MLYSPSIFRMITILGCIFGTTIKDMTCIFSQYYWKTGAIICYQEILRRPKNPQSDSISASPAQAVTGQCGPHHSAAQLLHQAERQLQAGRVH